MSKIDYKKIINDYREALRLCYGDEIADKSVIYTAKGWIYFTKARRFSDGSVGALSSIHGHTPYRAKEIIARTEELIRRPREQK